MPDKWIKRWQVPKSSGDGHWTVAVDKDGNYGCSCPVWKFRREECKHILEVKQNGGKEVKNLSEKERGELKLRAYAQKGYRYYCWYHEPILSWNRTELKELKSDPKIDDVKTFRVNGHRVVVIKENKLAYKQEFEAFINLLKKCNLRKKLVRNPLYHNSPFLIDKNLYWIKQKELRENLNNRWFDIVQHIVYNSTGIVNPNLPKGSVYSIGEWGRKITRLEKQFKFLK